MPRAAELLRKMRKRREQCYGPERDQVDVLIYLLEWRDAEEQDAADQIRRRQEAEKFTDCGRPAGSPYEGQE